MITSVQPAGSTDGSHSSTSVMKAVALTPGGSVLLIPENAADKEKQVQSAAGSSVAMRRQQDAADKVAIEVGPQGPIFTAGTVELTALGSQELRKELVADPEACRQQLAQRAARIAGTSLIAMHNVSAATLRAEEDPCVELNKRLSQAMPGHAIIKSENGTQLEVPLTTPAEPEEKREKRKSFSMLQIVVGACSSLLFLVCCCGCSLLILIKRRRAKEPLVNGEAAHDGGEYEDHGEAEHDGEEKETTEAPRRPSQKGRKSQQASESEGWGLGWI